MAQDNEKNLDITRQLVDAYKAANTELNKRVEIIKNVYKEQAKEDELIKDINKNLSKATENKRLLKNLTQEAEKGNVSSSDIEKERLKLQEKIKGISAARSLAEKAQNKAKQDGLKKEASLYKDIVGELDDALDNLRKMDEAAKGVADKAAQIEKAKLDYMDFGVIQKESSPSQEDIESLKNKNLENVYYKSKRILISNGKSYKSETAWREDIPSDPNDPTPLKVIDKKDFWD